MTETKQQNGEKLAWIPTQSKFLEAKKKMANITNQTQEKLE